MDTDTPLPPPEPPRASLLMPVAWLLCAALGSVAVCAIVGLVAATRSEEDGVRAAYAGAFPLGFLISGALAAVIVHFAIKRATPLLRAMAPLGCGCLGGGLLLAIAVIFFTAIFPSL